MIKNYVKKIKSLKEEFENYKVKDKKSFSVLQKEFEEITEPKRYKVPVFGDIEKNNALYVDVLAVSKYNKDSKFKQKKTQWNKNNDVKIYTKLISQGKNGDLFLELLNTLNYEKNKKAKNVLVEYCVSLIKKDIEEIKEKSKRLHYELLRNNKSRLKFIQRILIFFVIPSLILTTVLVGTYKR